LRKARTGKEELLAWKLASSLKALMETPDVQTQAMLALSLALRGAAFKTLKLLDSWHKVTCAAEVL